MICLRLRPAILFFKSWTCCGRGRYNGGKVQGMENIDMSTDRERPKTLAELETWRAKWARTLIGAHRSELEDADERHKARCEKLDKYFDIRSHEISKERSLPKTIVTPSARDLASPSDILVLV